ncbi:major facilitator superfamily protein [Nitritalea halalkaliphila LW7]|uniref:Major facilitator superfamily protein n=1 Tax=Nitritalea halalkaliphila LW7 TaxID=1189621 RepID=I5BWE9_9BACT|nr:MFS transporter [Nitritalea halalkaliphila]EIM73901.1 major facilitator superfamily protein [Nitritalea halalkaliphila LW7]
MICNVLLIPLIKKREPNRIGLLTSLYTTGMALFAAVASGLAAPLAEFKGFGWRGSLVSWALLVLIGIVLWWPQMQRKEGKQPRGEALPAGVSVWKSRLAWQVSMVLGVQSLLFFTLVSWFPDMLVARGYSTAKAGLLLSVMQLIGLAGSFLAPIFAVKFRQQQGAVSLVSAGYLIGFSLLFIENTTVLYVCMVILGTSMGSSISLAYTMIGLRTEDEQTTGALSGMAQSAGYYLAALGRCALVWSLMLLATGTTCFILC